MPVTVLNTLCRIQHSALGSLIAPMKKQKLRCPLKAPDRLVHPYGLYLFCSFNPTMVAASWGTSLSTAACDVDTNSL